jgi:hypothetical protein
MAAIGLAALGLGGCASYHQEVPALRMARPSGDSPELAAFARSDPDFPSVGGDILKGTSPQTVPPFGPGER